MARGTVRKRGKSWSFQIPDGRDPKTGGRRYITKGGFRTQREAQRAMNAVLSQLADGQYVAPLDITVGQFIEEWLVAVSPSLRPTTHRLYSSQLALYVVPAFGHVRLQHLTAGRLSAFNAALLTTGRADGTGLSAKSVRNVHGLVKRFLGDAVRWGYLERNPSDVVDPPRLQTPDMKIWSPQQIRTFLVSVADDPLYAAFHLLCTTGMRRGEVLGLRWQDIDFDNSRLSVRQALVGMGNSTLVSEPKTRRGRRSIALDDGTLAVLRSHKRRHAELRLAAGPEWVDTGLIFGLEDGSILHPESFRKRFTVRVRNADLPVIRVHDLRHSWASAALAAGVHPKVVSERLGHATVSITLDIYSHTVPAMDATAAETVAASIFGSGQQ